MTKVEKLNRCNEILASYTGNDKYIRMLINRRSGNYTFTKLDIDYVLANYQHTPETINRMVKIEQWLGEKKAYTWQIDFVPKVLYVKTLYGEVDNKYCCDVIYRKSNQEPTLTFLPKDGLLTPIRVADFKSINIDLGYFNDKLKAMNDAFSVMPHQVDSIKFLIARKKCILALDQGLGKSMAAVIASMLIPNSRVLIICPASLKSNWYDEITRFIDRSTVSIVDSTKLMSKRELIQFLSLPEDTKLKLPELHSMACKRGKWVVGSKYTIVNYDILDEFHQLPLSRKVTDVESALRNSKLIQSNFDIVIVDEAHKLSNSSSTMSKIMNDFLKKAKNRYTWLLTGTMMSNSPAELFNILRLIENDVTSNYVKYMERYAGAHRQARKGEFARCWNDWSSKYLDIFGNRRFTSYKALSEGDKKEFMEYFEKNGKFVTVTGEPANLDELSEKISHLYYRVVKENITGMVAKNIVPVAYTLKPHELTRYHSLWREFKESKANEEGKDVSEYKALMEGSVLRKYISQLMLGRTKYAIGKIISKGDKVFVVCSYDDEINELKRTFGDLAVVYNGKCNAKQKDTAVYEFNNNPKVMVFLGNINAAGVGINLNKACHIALFQNPNYTYSDFSQACDRIHRIGSKQDVTIYVQYYRDTIYEHMMDIIKSKQDVFNDVVKSEINKAAV